MPGPNKKNVVKRIELMTETVEELIEELRRHSTEATGDMVSCTARIEVFRASDQAPRRKGKYEPEPER